MTFDLWYFTRHIFIIISFLVSFETKKKQSKNRHFWLDILAAFLFLLFCWLDWKKKKYIFSIIVGCCCHSVLSFFVFVFSFVCLNEHIHSGPIIWHVYTISLCVCACVLFSFSDFSLRLWPMVIEKKNRKKAFFFNHQQR